MWEGDKDLFYLVWQNDTTIFTGSKVHCGAASQRRMHMLGISILSRKKGFQEFIFPKILVWARDEMLSCPERLVRVAESCIRYCYSVQKGK